MRRGIAVCLLASLLLSGGSGCVGALIAAESASTHEDAAKACLLGLAGDAGVAALVGLTPNADEEDALLFFAVMAAIDGSAYLYHRNWTPGSGRRCLGWAMVGYGAFMAVYPFVQAANSDDGEDTSFGMAGLGIGFAVWGVHVMRGAGAGSDVPRPGHYQRAGVALGPGSVAFAYRF